jgi:chromosome segregation ATPase
MERWFANGIGTRGRPEPVQGHNYTYVPGPSEQSDRRSSVSRRTDERPPYQQTPSNESESLMEEFRNLKLRMERWEGYARQQEERGHRLQEVIDRLDSTIQERDATLEVRDETIEEQAAAIAALREGQVVGTELAAPDLDQLRRLQARLDAQNAEWQQYQEDRDSQWYQYQLDRDAEWLQYRQLTERQIGDLTAQSNRHANKARLLRQKNQRLERENAKLHKRVNELKSRREGGLSAFILDVLCVPRPSNVQTERRRHRS